VSQSQLLRDLAKQYLELFQDLISVFFSKAPYVECRNPNSVPNSVYAL